MFLVSWANKKEGVKYVYLEISKKGGILHNAMI